MYQKKYHIHFVGIGGIGMSGIAELLLNLGYRVSGSDLAASDICDRLGRLGGRVFAGHAAGQIAGADVVVTSSAIGAHNPEVLAAREAGIAVIPRAEMLAELMRLKYSIAIAGAHGKTTTTSIVAAVLEKGRLDPTVVIGGRLKSIGVNARLGRGDFIVAEADESDGSFLKYTPTIAVVTNIDREHLDYFRDLEDIKAVFLSFIDRIPFYGLAVLCLDSAPVQDIIPRVQKRFTTYGLSVQADFQAREVCFEGLRSRFVAYRHGRRLGAINLNLPGIHNVYNALASIAVGLELDIDFATVRQTLETLEGVQRRLEVKGTVNDIMVVDDYGHHPTEIKTTLQAIGASWPHRRKVVLFQPHRYTRTQALFEEFTRSFYQCEALVLLPVYAASEREIPGVDSRSLCRAIQAHGHKDVRCFETRAAAVAYLGKTLRPGDIFLTLGAGDVWRAGDPGIATLGWPRAVGWTQNMTLDADAKNWLQDAMGAEVKFSEPMHRHTHFKIGGPAEAWVAPGSVERLAVLVAGAAERRLVCLPVGAGTNLLVKDGGIPGIVVTLSRCCRTLALAPGPTAATRTVVAGAGVGLPALCRFAVHNGLAGLAFALGIPGSVGGAVMMNAGTRQGCLADVLSGVQILLPGGQFRRIPRSRLDFGYRKMGWGSGLSLAPGQVPLILESRLQLSPAPSQRLQLEARRILRQRRQRQPVQLPSAGCIFKNPAGPAAAGELIDRAGLGGRRCGDAQISRRHANFIVNRGRATAADVLALIALARETVAKRFNVRLETEVKIVGV